MTRLSIHRRVVLARDDKTSTSELVRCPDEGRWLPADVCRKCDKRSSMDAASITCTPERATAPASGVDDAPITDVMDTGVLCVDMDARVESVASALDDHDAPLAVVIDRHGHAVGICSRRDLVSRAPTQRVETCMTPFLITMLESAKVADAIEAIVDRGLNHVPVLSEGRVLGLITPRAVIRWMAQRLRAPRSAHARRGSEG